MYTLRKINGDGLESNQIIGPFYVIVFRQYNYDEFCRSFKAFFNMDHVPDDHPEAGDFSKQCYAFINNGSSFFEPLYKGQRNYIMTESGQTFANVSFR